MINLLLLLAYYFLVVWIASCSKKTDANGGGGNNGGNNGNFCSPTKTAAENISFFPLNNDWNKDISQSPVDPYNDGIIAQFATTGLHPDFGSGTWNGAPIGIPYVVVCAN